jgi:hypothetical protein
MVRAYGGVDEGRIPKMLVMCRIGGTRRKDKSRPRWRTEVEEDLKGRWNLSVGEQKGKIERSGKM